VIDDRTRWLLYTGLIVTWTLLMIVQCINCKAVPETTHASLIQPVFDRPPSTQTTDEAIASEETTK